MKNIYLLIITLVIFSCKKDKPGSTTPAAPKSSEKSITSFAFRQSNNKNILDTDYIGIINADTINVRVYQGTNISGLTPSITYTGVSIAPLSGVLQNFNNLVNYTVTAEDGTTKKYTVKVNVVKSYGTVYVGSNDANLYAINANTGSLEWKFTTGGGIASSPTVVNNIVYFGSSDKYLYAVDAITGVLKWKFLTAAPIIFESPVVSNGVVFICSNSGYNSGVLYAVNVSAGTLKWSQRVVIGYSPAVYNGKVFLGDGENRVTALDEATGNPVWYYITGISKSNPAVYAGKLYTTGEGKAYCLNADAGTLVWSIPSLATNISSPTINNQTLYMATASETLAALDPNTGIIKWKFTSTGVNGNFFTSPLVDNGIVYAANLDGNTYALNATTGNTVWTFRNLHYFTPGVYTTPQVTVSNGFVYVGSDDPYLYALDGKTGAVKWKFTANAGIYSGPCIVDYDGNVFHAGISGAVN